MSFNLTKLDWDSNFFARPIYALRFGESSNNLTTEHGALITAKVDAKDYESVDKLNTLGFQFCEGEIDFIKNLEASTASEPIESYVAQHSDIESLESLCSSLYENSRFRAPWFTVSQRNEFYALWIRKAVQSDFDDICLVIRESSEIKGFVSIKIRDHKARIGLIGVHSKFQGQGIGKALLKLAEAYCVKNNAKSLSVATQTSNDAAILLYGKSNFLTQSISYWFYKNDSI
ncbi:dTDP-4-amino-4,6-dideoxy-D-galactose acyltransferase [Pseudoalteromonas umbrosa]|uniref:dTDP-4-amino-4,6-dideoxy-D-galactose acyltransferase n=1 Tax=Pseudoalteromonas umbrosa TaxID=3048489 RepID=UPI0024C3F186|nr:dTDP-4-amino-4,6-dideoxy-D-galactose acyltransferase [Pseudoalteromonas sp. B95]MDK1289582.1 dTDP-4-amino-4,6-dideoxy-D-galactose acyltransferase [Pseudoalteromonas sp. B95]